MPANASNLYVSEVLIAVDEVGPSVQFWEDANLTATQSGADQNCNPVAPDCYPLFLFFCFFKKISSLFLGFL